MGRLFLIFNCSHTVSGNLKHQQRINEYEYYLKQCWVFCGLEVPQEIVESQFAQAHNIFATPAIKACTHKEHSYQKTFMLSIYVLSSRATENVTYSMTDSNIINNT